jgi:valyl-tRNA synthetase
VTGAIDVTAERRRLEKDLSAARAEAGQATAKLSNENFTAKAPQEVVAKTRQRLETATAEIAQLERRLEGLPRPSA